MAGDDEDGARAFKIKDYETAMKVFKKACNGGGDTSSCFEFTRMYDYGKNVEQDLKKAKELFNKSCDDDAL